MLNPLQDKLGDINSGSASFFSPTVLPTKYKESYLERLLVSANYLKSRFTEIPNTLIVTGSGLSGVINSIQNPEIIPYDEIPNFTRTKNDGHPGLLIKGSLNETDVLVFNGRWHYHDGLIPQEVTFPIRLMICLGVKNIIQTNAAGRLSQKVEIGDLMVLEDHVFFDIDPNLGIADIFRTDKFYSPDLAYDKDLNDRFLEIAQTKNIRATSGVYRFLSGPGYQTRAEEKILLNSGCDAVGMSTIPDILAAKCMDEENELRLLAISAIVSDAAMFSSTILTSNEVIETANQCTENLAKVLFELVGELN
ncbi:MAG: purine-nucleoside phosphorylase [Pyrinomonadaceae bacterium]|nr:purine-nucleoside phosphorylase [Pyrinomonadaceae bacterium]